MMLSRPPPTPPSYSSFVGQYRGTVHKVIQKFNFSIFIGLQENVLPSLDQNGGIGLQFKGA